MGMPSFHGALEEAAKRGDRCLTCHWCGGWTWVPPEHELTEETRKAGRVFCPSKACERREGEARDAARAV